MINADKTIPVITVEEELIEVSLKATDEELLKGVSAHDEKDGDLTGNIIIESVSGFTEKGVSKITYAVCDSNNNVAKTTRKIRFNGYQSPKFRVAVSTATVMATAKAANTEERNHAKIQKNSETKV